jgi:hypothetical protein
MRERDISIARVHRPSARAFRGTYLKTATPVVITGLASDWPAVRDWSHDYLQRHGGSSPCSVQVSRRGVRGFETLPFAGTVRAILGDRGPTERYIFRHPLAHLPRELRAAVGSLDAYMGAGGLVPRRLEWVIKDGERLWIGPAGTVSDVHFDLGHNLFTQIVGRKHFRLFAPSPSAPLHGHSIDVDLHPGEILFLPQLWWHHVRALDASVSLSSFWVTPTMLPAQRAYWYHRAKRAFLSAVSS